MNNLAIEQKKTDIALAVTTTLAQFGLTSGELTYAAALRMYGGWFSNAVKNGRIVCSKVIFRQIVTEKGATRKGI